MSLSVLVLVAISRKEAKKGLPIVINEPIEMALVAGVLLLLAIPIYLAYRRRSLRRSLRR